jgi:hypothetical protein
MPQLLTDIRFGVRMLFKYPTLSLVAVLTLGVGIGLSTTVFCIVNGAMFKGLPFFKLSKMSKNCSERQEMFRIRACPCRSGGRIMQLSGFRRRLGGVPLSHLFRLWSRSGAKDSASEREGAT